MPARSKAGSSPPRETQPDLPRYPCRHKQSARRLARPPAVETAFDRTANDRLGHSPEGRRPGARPADRQGGGEANSARTTAASRSEEHTSELKSLMRN